MTHQDTPVLLLVFNRPEKVRKLLTALKKIAPKQVYISADGPRAHVPSDIDTCAQVRALVTNPPWECSIQTNFSDTNHGCMNGPVRGISWFFKHVDRGIILEDDCIPESSFFPFATELLARYESHPQIMHISGTSHLTVLNKTIPESYYFSRIAHGWGWATWRRAWEKMDLSMKHLSELQSTLYKEKIFLKPEHNAYWGRLFRHVTATDQGIWDSQWEYSILYHNGLCITPVVNLIENVGFDEEATHTKKRPVNITPVTPLDVEHIVHPTTVTPQREIDALEIDRFFLTSMRQRFLTLLLAWYDALTRKIK